jgi:phosphopentomutase
VKTKGKVILIALDGVGCGYAPDYKEYDNIKSNSLQNVIEHTKIELPNLNAFGLDNILNDGSNNIDNINYGKVRPHTKDNDSAPLHWEMMGIMRDTRFDLFPFGIPESLIEMVNKKFNLILLGNIQIKTGLDFDELRERSYRERLPAVYSTVDSVIQVMAHTSHYSPDYIYSIAEYLKKELDKTNSIGRVVAKMFSGDINSLDRAEHLRRDFATMPPEDDLLLRKLVIENFNNVAIGKIVDFFGEKYFNSFMRSKGNTDGLNKLLECIKISPRDTFIFLNLLDFDTLGGHNNNPDVYGQLLVEFDAFLPKIISNLNSDDLLIITSDHGNDPTVEVKTHTREYCPLIIYSKNENLATKSNLGKIDNFTYISRLIERIYLNP